MSWSSAAAALVGGSSSASGSKCGACAAKDIEIAALKAQVKRRDDRIKVLTDVINRIRTKVRGVAAQAVALRAARKPGYDLAQYKLARDILEIVGLL